MAPAANSSNDVTSSSRENYHAAADALQSSGYPTDKDKKVAHSIPTSISKTFGESSLLSLQAEQPNSDVEISESEPKNEPAAPPPDGGLQAWLQVLIAHLVIFNTWGYINLFGVFQTYYLSTLEQSPLQISWIGSVQVFLLFFIGTFSGRAIDAGYFRHTFVIGTVLILLGVFTTLVCTQYWQLFLAQGVCTGIGNGLLFCPTLAILPIYFNKKRVIVVRLAASGTTTGGIIIPGIFEALLPRVGFGWTLCVLGLIMLVFQDIYPAYYYVGEYASSIIGVSQGDSINLLIIINGIGIIGRLLPPYLSDRWTGPTNMMISFVVLSAVSLYCWAAIYTQGGLWAFATIYGLFSSGVNSLFPTDLSALTTDMSKMGVYMEMVYTVISFATLTGTPIAGALISANGGRYLDIEMFAVSLLMIGGILLVAARVSRTGWKLRVRM